MSVRMAAPVTGDDYVAPTHLPLGSGTVSWRISAFGFLGASRALLLQTSHPLVAAGVAQHSDYQTDPFSRGYRTFDTVLKLVFGSPEISRRQTSRMDKRHRPVTGESSDGRGCDARDPELGLWGWATLVDTVLVTYEHANGRLRPRDRARFYEEQKLFGEGCSIPRDLLPETMADFEAYVARVVAEDLEATEEGRDVAHFTFNPPAVPVVGPAIGRYLAWSAAAMFPPRVRAMYDLDWTAAQQQRYERFMRTAGAIDRVLPTAVTRTFPIDLVVKHDLLDRLERGRARKRAERRRAKRAA